MNRPTETNASDSRDRLICAAAEAFKEEGYRASIDRIAMRAGVARQTVYNHFACKNDLFSEVANVFSVAVLVSLDGDRGDIRESLLRFATALREKALGDHALAMFRTIAAETHRFPDLARAFFVKGPDQMVRRVTEFLTLAMDHGTLKRDDPVFAAEMLLSMLEGYDRTCRLFGAPPRPAEQEQDRVARIVDCFLSAYAPEKKRP
jgi:TetR/AcrR family transcriptional repressor of mexJK operon